LCRLFGLVDLALEIAQFLLERVDLCFESVDLIARDRGLSTRGPNRDTDRGKRHNANRTQKLQLVSRHYVPLLSVPKRRQKYPMRGDVERPGLTPHH